MVISSLGVTYNGLRTALENNFKTRISSRWLHLCFNNLSDMPVRRPTLESGPKLSDCGRRTFCNCFNVSIIEITNRAGDPYSPGLANRKVPKPDSLNPALHCESPRYHKSTSRKMI